MLLGENTEYDTTTMANFPELVQAIATDDCCALVLTPRVAKAAIAAIPAAAAIFFRAAPDSGRPQPMSRSR